jgi:hypothetical protein
MMPSGFEPSTPYTFAGRFRMEFATDDNTTAVQADFDVERSGVTAV